MPAWQRTTHKRGADYGTPGGGPVPEVEVLDPVSRLRVAREDFGRLLDQLMPDNDPGPFANIKAALMQAIDKFDPNEGIELGLRVDHDPRAEEGQRSRSVHLTITVMPG